MGDDSLNAADLLDVVDERDEVIGRERRDRVHREGLRHRAVHVLVFDGAGRLFLQKRSALKDCFPGCWDSSAAGHLDFGETYDACAIRELEEELGISAPPLERLFKVGACPETGQEFVWVYRCRHDGGFALNSEEIECGRWVEPGELDRWIEDRPLEFASSLPLIWRRARNPGQGESPVQ